MTMWKASQGATDGRRPVDGSPQTEARAGQRPVRRPWLQAIASALVAAVCLMAVGEAQAQRLIQIGGAKRTANISVYIGKSEDVRTDTSFIEITVGDPDVADVNPLTDRSLSILGKKSGTSRVSIYGEGKKLIGVFDVEVRYDTSMLASEIARRFPMPSSKWLRSMAKF